jgi:hypothetical protein
LQSSYIQDSCDQLVRLISCYKEWLTFAIIARALRFFRQVRPRPLRHYLPTIPPCPDHRPRLPIPQTLVPILRAFSAPRFVGTYKTLGLRLEWCAAITLGVIWLAKMTQLTWMTYQPRHCCNMKYYLWLQSTTDCLVIVVS